MKVINLSELPAQYTCRQCGKTKPLDQMVVIRQKREGIYCLRPKCKDCQNAYNRTLREWRRDYLRKWRKRNAALDRSYWDNPEAKTRYRENSSRHFKQNHEAILIKGRLQRRGQPCTLAQAREYLAKYGPNFPTLHGLTIAGKRECERIRSQLRRQGVRISSFEIRMMVYEDSAEEPRLLKKPSAQKFPYKARAKNLQQWHQERSRK